MAESIALPHWTVASAMPSTGNEEVDRELRLRLQAIQENFEGVVSQAAKQLEGAFQQRVPAGVIFGKGSTNVPPGYLACNGAAVSRSTYADLFNDIGTTYGAGDGSTTFNLPPYNDGRFPRGNATPGGTGGALSHDHSVSTSVSITGSGSTGFGSTSQQADGAVLGDPGSFTASTAVHTHTVSVTGSGSGSGSTDSQSNFPIYRDMFFIIKT